MIKALIVDDERLVRKGFIAAIPWETYGIEVIGEAGNGARALEFLEEHQTDLLITDLSMPVMTGFELMEVVREKYPSITVGVLTCHQDFKYIQDALRLGAVDYILKTELDNGALEEAVARIADRVVQSAGLRQTPPPGNRLPSWKDVNAGDWICLDLPKEECSDAVLTQLSGKCAVELEAGGWFVPFGKQEMVAPSIEWKPESYPGWFVVRVEGLSVSGIGELSRLLHKYRQTVLFYEYEREKRFYTLDVVNLSEIETDEANFGSLERDWLAAGWIFDEEGFRNCLNAVRRLRMTALQLKKLFYGIFSRLEGMIPDIRSTGWFEHMDSLPYWVDWQDQLTSLRNMLASSLKTKDFTEEIVAAVFRAVDILNQDIGIGITQEALAQKVNMSRGYLSYCFKEIVGRPFKTYLKELRIEAAKRLLVQTNETVAEIAERVGFQDQRYFSSVFYEETGLQPREYRQSLRQPK